MATTVIRNDTSPMLNRDLAAGAFAGFIGGIFMALLLMAGGRIAGAGTFEPLRAIGHLFQIPSLSQETSTIFWWGLAFHLGFATLLGLVFAMIVPYKAGGVMAVLSGLSYGILVWVASTFVLLPLLRSGSADAVLAGAPSTWLLAHLVYGITLAATPMIERRLRPTSRHEVR